MQQHNNVSWQWSLDAWSQLKRPLPRRRLSSLVAILLALATLACGFIETNSRSPTGYIVLTRLPTLTRTPLPTLTPTFSSDSVAVAMDVESVETGPFLVSQPVDAAAASDVSANISALEPTLMSVVADEDASHQIADAVETIVTSPPIIATNAPSHTPSATPTATAIPTSTPTATATEIPPTDTPTPPPTPTPLPEGWVFIGVKFSTAQSGGNPLLYGDVINNTGASQELFSISGEFYDNHGQLMPNVFTAEYWPIDTIPQGGQVPFELIVVGLEDPANFNLSVDAAPSEKSPYQDFEFLDVVQSTEEDGYCLSGKVQNLGGNLEDYLSIVAVLYDSQDTVINFSDHFEYSPDLDGNGILDFELCADPFEEEVTHYELRAWGL